MTALRIILLLFLIACAVAVSFSKRLLTSVVIYMAFSLVMASSPRTWPSPRPPWARA